MRIRGRHYITSALIDVTCHDGRIVQVSHAGAASPDFEAGWIAPGLFDLQINGGGGIAFGSPTLTVAEVRRVVGLCHGHGITGLCPTLITGSLEDYLHGFGTLRQACEEDASLAHAMPCFHLEGPYISPEDGPRGAHPRKHVRPPSREEFLRLQDAAGGRIRLVTLAPEIDGALPFIEWLTTQGIVVAIGHTAATPAIIRDAVKAGASLSTHLGNGSHAVLPRHDNYLWEQLATDTLWASIITDGHHLPAAVARCIVRVKPVERLIVTCDASNLAGLPPGLYRAWDTDLEVLPRGKVVVRGTPYLAGSGVFTDDCLNWLLGLGELSLVEAIESASSRPRKLLRLPETTLAPGCPADLVLFDHSKSEPFRVRATLAGGIVHASLASAAQVE
jgi:N-acetylglucosamine-6-phosphate deacetylase